MATRSWVLTGVGVVVVAAGLGWWSFGRAPKTTAPMYQTVPVERGSVVGRVTATGTVSALVTVQVGAQVSGRILKLEADFNSAVKKGQVLARLDPELFDASLAQSRANEKAAEANVAKAKAQAAESERKLVRAKALAAERFVAQADLDTAVSEAEVAKAGIGAAEAALLQAQASRKQAEVNVAYTIIKSPIDGTVISRAVDVGQTVAASLSAPTLFTIAENLARMQVDTSISEADIGKLQEGADATFTVDAFTGRTFQGRIRQLRYNPTVVSNVVTYNAVIDVENPELLLRPGMTANVTFVFARVDDALKVPNAALRLRMEREAGAGRPDGGFRRADAGVRPEGLKLLWVLRAGLPSPVRVKTGVTDGSMTEVLEGELKEGDEVITEALTASSTTNRAPGLGGPGAPGGGMRRGPF